MEEAKYPLTAQIGQPRDILWVAELVRSECFYSLEWQMVSVHPRLESVDSKAKQK